MKKKLRGYIFSRPFFEERVPQHIQNLVLRNYCEKNNFFFLLSYTEYRMKNSSLMLNSILKNIKDIDGIVFYSLFQMPVDTSERQKIYSKILKSKKELHFAVENIKANTIREFNKIDNIYLIKKTIPNCIENFQVKNK